MNGFTLFVDGILPYITAIVLVAGIVWRLWQWFRVPVPLRIGLSPSPKTGSTFLGRLTSELFIFRTFFFSDRNRWYVIWPFHLALVLTLLHHLLGFSQDLILQNGVAINLAAMADILFVLALTAWVLILLLLLILAYRFYNVPVRTMSTLADYFALFLILAVIGAGTYMTFFGHTTSAAGWSETAIKWGNGLLTFHPSSPGSLAFSIHFLLVQLLIMYFPFSKLFHPMGQVASVALTPKEELLNPEGSVVK